MTMMTRAEFIADFKKMAEKVALEYGMTTDEVIKLYALACGGRIVNKKARAAKK
jgi:antitoxin component of RelBE/YafQ-DinJ toxin-antitoxin module